MADKYNVEQIDWDVPPPDEEEGPFVPILSPRPEAPVEALVVSPAMIGVMTHFLGNRTHPCTGQANGCEGCAAELKRRWKGYLGGWHVGYSRYVLLELTHAAAQNNKAVLLDKSKNLRGLTVRLWRNGRNRNARVQAEVKGPKWSDDKVPVEFDVRRALLRVWAYRADRRVKRVPGELLDQAQHDQADDEEN